MATRTQALAVAGSSMRPTHSLALSIVKMCIVLSAALGNALAVPLLNTRAISDRSFSVLRHGRPDEGSPQTSYDLVIDVLSIAALVLGGGLCAGLTLSLMGLDSVNLQVLSTAGSDAEKRNATKVLRLLERGRHWVLVVLLLSNVIVNEALPIFLSDFGESSGMGGTTAVLISTVLIVIFGEVLPQSICARYGLSIGAACAPFVWVLMIVLAPVAWPTAKLLDWSLGADHGTTYKKAELKTFVSLHQQLGTENLNEDEVTIIRAVLDLNDKTVEDVMTPIQDVFIMSADTILNDEGVGKLVQSGYSRVPIHEKGKPDSIIGMLLVKDLISYDPEDGREVASFQLRPLPETSADLTLLSVLNYFQTGRSHMLLVSRHPGEPKGAMGIVTLEDVVEELIGEEIIDETDVWVDVHNRVRVSRNPKEGPVGGAGGGGADLGPLVRGIIERRRLGGLKPKAGSQAPLNKAVDRVLVKTTDSPTRYSYDHNSVADGSSPLSKHNLLPPRRASSTHVEGRRAMVDSADGASTEATLFEEPHAISRSTRNERGRTATQQGRGSSIDESQPLLGNGGAKRR